MEARKPETDVPAAATGRRRRVMPARPAIGPVAWLCLSAAALIAPAAMASAAEPVPAAEPAPAGEAAPPPEPAAGAPSELRSPEDGWFDISAFLDQAYGFVPLLIPITEPAVGFGAAGAAVFIDKPEGEAQPGLDRPNITAFGGFATDNGTSGFLVGDVRHWRDNRVQTVVGGICASLNLQLRGRAVLHAAVRLAARRAGDALPG